MNNLNNNYEKIISDFTAFGAKDKDIIRFLLTEDMTATDSRALSPLTLALGKVAEEKRKSVFDTDVFIRGLIEFTNYCKNDCYYCGIRCSNSKVARYRLTKEEILSCCQKGIELGFKTFVLQGGEDLFYNDAKLCSIISEIKELSPDCAITLSIGERTKESYLAYYNAGADRYLLRHETASKEHYNKLHPASMSHSNRQKCLYNLKEIGYEVGSGFMVGSPYQTIEDILCDLEFLKELKPDMIGIGPYISHVDTPFNTFPNGSVELTLRLISILRLLFPGANIPATTALGTLHPKGRELGIKAGANVLMPNLSPESVRAKYTLYNNKLCTGDEAAEQKKNLEQRISGIGYKIVEARGDSRC